MHNPDLKIKLLALFLVVCPGSLLALETDRQQQLLVNADATDGTLGDGLAILRGNVEIQQGTLLVKADVAEVEKADGKVREVVLSGSPVVLQQEIENEGLVRATAEKITYQVATGIVTLTGGADVNHPQYQISGELLTYDMNKQHFQGSGGDGNGRIRIELAPEVVPGMDTSNGAEENKKSETTSSTDGDLIPPGEDELSESSEEKGDAQG
jgi:lipopolysaccharide export system protein LptA